MADDYTEITNNSYFSRIKNAFAGVIFGLILFIGSFYLLIWNEGRTAHRAETLSFAEKNVMPVSAEKPAAENEGKLVYITAQATTAETLSDPLFKLQLSAIHLKRIVEMYQWQETKHQEEHKHAGGSSDTVTTYSYDKIWSEKAINSSSFKQPEGHSNPPMLYKSEHKQAGVVAVGGFAMDKSFIDDMVFYSDAPFPDADYNNLAASEQHYFTLQGGQLIHSSDPAQTQIGDMKVHFQTVAPKPVSVIGKQTGSLLMPYMLPTGSIALVAQGAQDALSMIQDAETKNTLIAWGLRLLGFFLMGIGLAMILAPISVLADIVPFLGGALGFIANLGAFSIALVLSAGTIALSWLAYRPLWALGLMLAALVLAFLRYNHRKQKTKTA